MSPCIEERLRLLGMTVCDCCDEPVHVWPARDCETPEQHVRASYACPCGDVVTVMKAIDNPSRHKRCNEIGAVTAAFLFAVVALSLLGLVIA